MNAHERAKEYWQQQPLFLDTQTTGLGPKDEVVQVAVVDWWGRVLLDTLVKPTIPIPPAASAIHGITDDMVADAPTFKDIAPALKGLLEFETVVIYNTDYDLGLLRQTAAAHGLEGTGPFGQAVCAMLLYAEYAGERSMTGLPKWWKLGDAAANCGFSIEAHHTAAGDANATRLLLQYMATHPQPVREKVIPTEAGDVYVDPDQLEGSLSALMTLWGKRRKELDHIEERIRQDVMALGASQRVGNV